jgi:hypothetical protein
MKKITVALTIGAVMAFASTAHAYTNKGCENDGNIREEADKMGGAVVAS